MRKLKNEELQRKTVAEFKAAAKTPLTIVLDNIRSLNNIGSVFRTADAFLIEKIYLCGICATPPHRDIHKTALGATDNVEWEYAKNTLTVIEKLQRQKYCICAIEQTDKSQPLHLFQPSGSTKYAFVFGNEVKGVAQEVIDQSDQAIEIPQFGTKHSLNISVSVGILLWDFLQKRSLK